MDMSEQGLVDARQELMSFRLDEQEYCVDITAVREIRGWTPATPLPQTPSYVKGVINLRGQVLPVIDLAARFGMAPRTPTERHVIMVVRIGSRTVGVLVDAVSDILNIEPSQVQATPEVAAGSVKPFVTGLITLENRMISRVDLTHVLEDELGLEESQVAA